MKDIFKKINKKSLTTIYILKTFIYVIWSAIATLFLIFINDGTTKSDIVLLFAFFAVLMLLRYYLKNEYYKKRNKTYYSIKHNIEIYLFNKINGIKTEDVYDLDKKYLSNKTQEFTYNLTKLYSDIERTFIPFLIGAVLVFIVTAKLSILLALAIYAATIGLTIYRYKSIIKEDNYWSNYNDLLKDFIEKLTTIKKLHIFDFALKKIKEDKEVDNVIVENDYKEDYILNDYLILLLCGLMVFVILKLDSFSIIGHMCFYAIMILKLRKLIFRICPAIKNIFHTYASYHELDSVFKNNREVNIVNTFKHIELNNMKYTRHDDSCVITVNSLEIEKGDEISIIGKPGQGKSVILNVLSGMYKLDEGRIIVDNETLNGELDLAYLSTNDQIFNLSLRENLSLGMKVSDEVILQFIDEVNLSEWFGLLHSGLDTILDPEHVEITPTDMIKLNVIRAVILDKPLYLIDDFEGYLEIEDEKAISEIIKKYLRKKTFVIVAHKPIFTTICKKHYFIKNNTLLEKETLL